MLNARQRVLLKALGILLWIPRATNTHKVKGVLAEQSIWRTDAEPEPVIAQTEPVISPVTPSSTGLDSVTHQPIVAKQQEPQQVKEHLQPESKPAQITAPLEVKTLPVDVSLVEKPISMVQFRIQACEINQWVVVVNEEDLKNPQRLKLWQSIQQAFQKNNLDQQVIHQFAWPLSDGARWQSAVGAKSAFAGFLFKMGLDKRIGLMSELVDEVCPDRIERLPHLAELLEEPLKKRMLWNLLK